MMIFTIVFQQKMVGIFILQVVKLQVVQLVLLKQQVNIILSVVLIEVVIIVKQYEVQTIYFVLVLKAVGYLF